MPGGGSWPRRRWTPKRCGRTPRGGRPRRRTRRSRCSTRGARWPALVTFRWVDLDRTSSSPDAAAMPPGRSRFTGCRITSASMRFLRRHSLPLLLAAAAFAPATASAADACPGADQRPSSGTDVRAATVCLINVERTSRNLVPLDRNAQLDAAALGWSTRMVVEGFFAHEATDSDLTARVSATGYLPAQKWRIGENLAWGEQDQSTPIEIVKDWMGSEGHRANILDPNFRDIGIGIVVGRPGAPTGDSATYTTDFGAVSGKPATTAKTTTPGDDSATGDDDVTSSYEDPAAKPAVKRLAAAKKKKAAAKKKASHKKRSALRARRGRSAQDARRRRELRKKLRMTAFAGHQRG